MVNRFIKYVKAFFVSLEFLAWVIIMSLYFLDRKFIFSDIYTLFFKTLDLEQISFTYGIPTALIGISYFMAHNILNPDKERKKLYNWPDYNLFKRTVIIGLIWNIIAFIITGIIHVKIEYFDNDLIGALYCSGCFASALSTLSLVLARQKINEIIITNTKDD